MSGNWLREKAPIHGALVLLIGALVGLQLTYSEPGLLYLAPAILLLAVLAFGHYPGEQLLEAVARAWHSTLCFERSAPPRLLVLPRSSPRGGVLLAMALAGRGPPP
jgi:hypothetical protein